MPRIKVTEDQSFQPSSEFLSEKGNYSVILYETRLKLIEMVFHEGESILKSARQLDIKPSTAKYICSIYKSEGRVMKKTVRKRKSKKVLMPKSLQVEEKKENDDQSKNESKKKQLQNANLIKLEIKQKQSDKNSGIENCEKTFQTKNSPYFYYFPLAPINFSMTNYMNPDQPPIFYNYRNF